MRNDVSRFFNSLLSRLIMVSCVLFFSVAAQGEDGKISGIDETFSGIEYFPEKYLSSRPVQISDFSDSEVKDKEAFEALFAALEKDPFSETLPHAVLSSGMRSNFFDMESANKFLDLAEANQDALDLNLCAACLVCTTGGGIEMASYNVTNVMLTLDKMPKDKYTMHHVRLCKAALRFCAAVDVMQGNGLEGLKTFEQSETLCKDDVTSDRYSYLIDAFLQLRNNVSAMEGNSRPNVLLATQRVRNDAVCRMLTDKCLSEIENDGRGLGAHSFDCISLLRAGRGEDLKRIVLVKLAENPEDNDVRRFAVSVYNVLGEYANAARLMRQVVLSYGAGNCPLEDCVAFAELARKAKFFDVSESACRVAELLEGGEENSVAIDLNLALALYEKGDYREAVAALRTLPDSRMKYFISAYALYRMKEYAATIGAAIKGIETVEPGQTAIPYDMLSLCADASDKLGDMSFIDKVGIPQCEMVQDNAEFLNTIGYICADRSHELDKAEQFIFKALAYQPHNGAFLDSAAWVKYRKKDYASAVKYMEKCLKEFADEGDGEMDAVILDHAGDVYSAAGDKIKAVSFWRKALKSNGDIDNEKVLAKIEAASKKP